VKLGLEIPLLSRGDYQQPSVFDPANVIDAVRRQKSLPSGAVPPVCVLDPDGDIATWLREHANASLCTEWACFHTELWEWSEGGARSGVIAGAVGASFAVLLAEQLFASGCELLISVASAGDIAEGGLKRSYVIIERALRDEGTSYHYLPPAPVVDAHPYLVGLAEACGAEMPVPVRRGASWTTDAPFRETADAIALRRAQGFVTVEMEAAALYAFAQAREKPVLCIAYVTNTMGGEHCDFEKGDGNGAALSLSLIGGIAERWRAARHVKRGAA
jgi:uridine phosphorylase